ncbi:hypothetical protein FS837_004754 [Tulasnella sp. UAMH 9824]|nr:hypothetical protein FS837_004754 [Tulasnella sp. UAMH 9824]
MALLDNNAQASLIRTCRYFHHLLEIYLYRHINPARPLSQSRNDYLFRTLAEREDLLPYIITYHGQVLPCAPYQGQSFLDRFRAFTKSKPENFEALPINETETFRRAVTIFTKAVNIIDLQLLHCSEWESEPLFDPIKNAVAKMSLRRLTVSYCSHLPQILRDQPELEELQIGYGYCPLEQLEETDAPKLRSLSAELLEAADLVPGRPIKQLNLDTPFGLPGFDRRLFERLSLSTGPVIEFSCWIGHPQDGEAVRSSIRAIARNLPSVEKLTLGVGGIIAGEPILDEIPSLLSIRALTFLRARLATAEERAIATDPPPSNHLVPTNRTITDWDDLFSCLKDRCPLLVTTTLE